MILKLMISNGTLLVRKWLQGAITKRMTAIEEMAGMDVLCSDKTGTLTLNKLTVDKNLIEVVIEMELHFVINVTCRLIVTDCKIYLIRFLQKE